MRRLPIPLWLLLLGALAPSVGQEAENAWSLTSGDFSTRRVKLLEVTESAVRVVQPDGQTVELPIEQLVRLERTAAPGSEQAEAAFVLHLRNGDRLHGRPVQLTDTALVFEGAPFGKLELPLESLAALTSGPEADQPWRMPQPAADEVLLSNGDQLRGYLSGLEGAQWTFSDDRGAEVPLGADSVRQVRFADPGVAAPPAPEKGWRIKASFGGPMTLDSLSFTGDGFLFGYRGKQATVTEQAVLWLEPVNGPVRWLSDLPAAEAEHVPYLGAAFPIIADDLPGGGRGFTVRSRSRLVFEIPPGFDRFRTLYAMDKEMPRGSADVRILLDDKLAHEHKALTAAESPEPVEISLEGATRLTLEVDYGEGLDVQDVVHWISPALVRATEPG